MSEEGFAGERSTRQFHTRHLLGLMGTTALFFAVAGPAIRRLDHDQRVSAAIQAAVAAIVVLVVITGIFFAHQRVSRSGGKLLASFERTSSQILHWTGVGLFAAMYLGTVYVDLQGASAEQRETTWVLGSPHMLLILTNYLVVRVWWGINPSRLDVREHGLIIGGFNFIDWDSIRRYSWTGNPTRQLNLFMKQRTVLNLKVQESFKSELETILDDKIVASRDDPSPA